MMCLAGVVQHDARRGDVWSLTRAGHPFTRPASSTSTRSRRSLAAAAVTAGHLENLPVYEEVRDAHAV